MMLRLVFTYILNAELDAYRARRGTVNYSFLESARLFRSSVLEDIGMFPRRYPESRPLGEDQGLWWVIHTKPNCEKMIATYLYNRGISYYLPLYRKKERIGYFRRIRVVEIPLFRGYVCMALEKEQHHLLYDSKKWVKLIKVGDQIQFLGELEAIEKAISEEAELIVRPGLVPGRKVLVQSGPLKGLEGVLLKRRSGTQLGLKATLFNQTVHIKLDAFTKLEALD
ncbi:MAG: hypothetical protein QG577_2644 [Thermodesulfobacteriota bacterium]|nr:hypothetical protein [Thermodesulfobacteriota bacterium]